MRGQLVAVPVEVGDQPVEQDDEVAARGRYGQPLVSQAHFAFYGKVYLKFVTLGCEIVP